MIKKVILIDDEPWAIESLFHAFSWKEFGFRVIGKYANPLIGWQAIMDDSPDVVFVDIRMPEMSGLEIAEKANSLVNRPIIIIVSGIESFEYAQQALRLGIFDYCLKPVERITAWKLLSDLSVEITKRHEQRCENTLEDIQRGLSGDELFRQLKTEIVGEYWMVAVFRFVDDKALSRIMLLMKDFSFVRLKLGITKVMFVINGDERIGSRAEHVFSGMTEYPQVMIGLSRVSCHANHLYQRVNEAQSCSYYDFMNSNIRLLAYHAQEDDEVEKYTQELIHSIENRDKEKWSGLIEGFQAMLIEKEVQMHNICRIWNRLMDSFSQFGNGLLSEEIEWITDAEGLRFFLGDVKEMTKYLDTLMHQLLEQRALVSASNVNQSFQRLLSYVQTHYNQKLRLCDLASQYHLNMAYCSELFRKVVGCTYTEYVTKLRMDNARKALIAGERNLQKLALESGYGDYFTFSKRFKQYFNCPPTKYCQEN